LKATSPRGKTHAPVLDLSKLNAPQREAVVLPEGPVLVLAGAGSGKTGVIVHRIARLMEEGADPESILAVTFTNKAAIEMQERLRALVGVAAKSVRVSTFHGFGLWFLREEHRIADLPRWFAICDAGDQAAILKRCLRDVVVDARRFDVRRVLAGISREKNAGASRGAPRPAPRAGAAPPRRGDDDYEVVTAEVLPRYVEALRAQRSLDFDDLLVRPVALLHRNAGLRGEYRERFRHVLVDEFQDTNSLQLELLKLLCAENRGTGAGTGAGRRAPTPMGFAAMVGWAGRSLCAVGDDDQAIYGWRGADLRNILGFERHFPGATVIRLEQNYRSTGRILDCANGVIARSSKRRPKRLWTDSGPGHPVRIVALSGEQEEARFIAGEVGKARAEGRQLADIAVLYRLNAQSGPIEEALREAGIPHRVRGGPAFFERSEVRDALAWLKACAYPDDDLSIARIANVPPRGIGDVAMARVGEWAAAQRLSLGAAMARAASVPDIPRGAPERMTSFVELLARFRQRFQDGSLAETARGLVEEIGLVTWVRESVVSFDAAARKVDGIMGVLRSLDAFERRDPAATLRAYLHRLALDSRDEEPDEAEGVRLMTLHSAKGLEFPVVFLVGFEEDLIPVSGIQGEDRDLEEERRLAYVGITRAREVLWVTRASARTRRGRLEPRTPSRFLADFPAGAHLRHDPASSASAEDASERSEEVLRALRERLAGAK
jgi:DNA helicase-2/ATP-dependent DNA helicase PcrA